LISPYFPPMGVVGAKRPLHLVRNLPRFGWNAAVLAAPPDRENLDPSLAAAVPESAIVSRDYAAGFRRWMRPRRRAKGRPREKRVFFLGREMPILWPFDPYLVDGPGALAAALRLVARHPVEAIAVCADPFSAFFVAMALRRRTGLPLVLDLRDPWSLHPGRRTLRPAPTRAAIDAVESAALRAASKVILNTEDCLAAYVDHYADRIPADRFTVIRNACDPEVFGSDPVPRESSFVVLHLGYFRRFVPSLPLLEGFAAFVRAAGLAPGGAVLRCVGGLRAEDEADVERLGIGGFVEARPAVPYLETMPLLRAADVLAVVVDPRSRLCIPAKVYDYLGARRPILAISDVDEVNRIVTGAGAGVALPIGDPGAVGAALANMHARWKRGELSGPDPESVRPYGALEQARRFAAVLDEVTAA
jgi:hypothetical protein